ncbi:hypothetical protein LCGC14_0468610 [marine sediment metagenome]|uniref:Uncharacterized protein n=1 Tax=marine sediment metagenome TaxID=412755 RepID=A0A0F9SCZ3_9ZZZZ
MKLLTILLIGLTLSACASSREPLPNWAEARQDFSAPVYAKELPLLCELPWATGECWAAIEQYEEVSEANYDKANLNASALNKMEDAYNAAISGGEIQQQVSELYRDQLDEERKDHFWDNVMHKVVIGVGLLLGAVL